MKGVVKYMENKIRGIVEAKSDKYNGGLKINNVWYNGNEKTASFVKPVTKESLVEITVDEKNKIQFLKVIEPAQHGKIDQQQLELKKPKEQSPEDTMKKTESTAEIVRKNAFLMKLCKTSTDETFGKDPNYKESMGQHCNSLFISTERACRVAGLL